MPIQRRSLLRGLSLETLGSVTEKGPRQLRVYSCTAQYCWRAPRHCGNVLFLKPSQAVSAEEEGLTRFDSPPTTTHQPCDWAECLILNYPSPPCATGMVVGASKGWPRH